MMAEVVFTFLKRAIGRHATNQSLSIFDVCQVRKEIDLISSLIANQCQAPQLSYLLPRLRFRPELSYDQTHPNAHPYVLRPKLQGLDSGSSEQ